ncbi:hypothetical protein ACM66B_006892 [Microbotryomycetes sp. NB124-2]
MVLQNKHKQIASRRYQRRHQSAAADGHDARADLETTRHVAVHDQPDRYQEGRDTPEAAESASELATASSDEEAGPSEDVRDDSADQRDAQLINAAQAEEGKTIDEQEEQERQAVDELVRKHAQTSQQSMFDDKQGLNGILDDIDDEFAFLKIRSGSSQRSVQAVAKPLDDSRRTEEAELSAARRLVSKQSQPRRTGQPPPSKQRGNRKHDTWLDDLLL